MVVLLALLSSLLIGLTDVLSGAASRRRPPIAVAALFHVSALAVTLMIAIARHSDAPATADVLIASVAGVLGGIAWILFLEGMRRGRMAVVSPITAATTIVVPVLIGLGRGERPSPLTVIGLAVIAVAVPAVAAAVDDGSVAAPRPLTHQVALAASAGGLVGLAFALIGFTDDRSGSWPAVMLLVGGGVVCWLALAATRTAPGRPSLPIAIAGITTGVGNVALTEALQRGPIAVAAVLGSLYPLVVATVAAVVLKERLARLQVVGIAGVCAGVALVSSG